MIDVTFDVSRKVRHAPTSDMGTGSSRDGIWTRAVEGLNVFEILLFCIVFLWHKLRRQKLRRQMLSRKNEILKRKFPTEDRTPTDRLRYNICF